MNIRTKSILATLAIAIIATAVIVNLSNRDAIPAPTTEIAGNSEPNRVVATEPTSHSGSNKKSLDALSAEELIASLQSRVSPGTETYIRVQVAFFCEQSIRPQMSTQQQSESQIALKAFKKSFCLNYKGTISSEQLKLLSLPESDPYTQAYGMANELFEAIGRTPPDLKEVSDITKQLDAMMVSSDSQMEALVAAETLKQAEVIAPTTAQFAEQSGWQLQTQDLAQAQFLSAQMKVCRKLGGCGSNQLMTMKICSEQSSCALGATTDVVWRRTYSPAVYHAASQLSMHTHAL